MKYRILLCSFLFTVFFVVIQAKNNEINKCNIIWDSQSINSGESMPCGGGDIGLNVWVENGELLFYISRSGTFDENNAFLKLGRVRVKLTPNPLNGTNFRQELLLQEGYIKIDGSDGEHSMVISSLRLPLTMPDLGRSSATKAFRPIPRQEFLLIRY